MFKDREQAGKQVAQTFKSKLLSMDDLLVVGLLKGGIPVAYEIAKELNLPLQTISVKKMGVPSNPELALGAVTEEGGLYLNHDIIRFNHIDEQTLSEMITQAQKAASTLAQEIRKDKPIVNFRGKNIILVDDGIATGATIKATINQLRKHEVNKIILVIPVSSYQAWKEISLLVDKFYVLDTPYHFYAVGRFYEEFPQVQMNEVNSLLNKMEMILKNSKTLTHKLESGTEVFLH